MQFPFCWTTGQLQQMFSISLLARNSNRISLVFKARGKNHIFRRARKRLLYAGFAILHSCQLHCPIDVKNGNGSSNAFPGWRLQFFLFSTRHLCCSTDEELGQQNAVINQKAPKNLLYKSQVRKKKRFGCSQLFSSTYLILKHQTTKCLLLYFLTKATTWQWDSIFYA